MNVQDINRAIINGNLSYEELLSVNQAVRYAINQIGHRNRFVIKLGTEVKFKNHKNGLTYRGTVVNIARKFAKVQTSNTTWRVPCSMLEAV